MGIDISKNQFFYYQKILKELNTSGEETLKQSDSDEEDCPKAANKKFDAAQVLDFISYNSVLPKIVKNNSEKLNNKLDVQENLIVTDAQKDDIVLPSLVEDFSDVESMFAYLEKISNGEITQDKGLNYEQLFKLAQDEPWNEKNNKFFQVLFRNFDAVDTDGDSIISSAEMTKVTGLGFNYCGINGNNGFFANMLYKENDKMKVYDELSTEAKLSKVINEARKYLEMTGNDELLDALNSYSFETKKLNDMSIGGFCNSLLKEITINLDYLNGTLYYATSVLLHELNHAKDNDFGNSLAEECAGFKIAEDYLDTVGYGDFDSDIEAKVFVPETFDAGSYKYLPENGWQNIQDKTFAGKIISGAWHFATTAIVGVGSFAERLLGLEKSHTVSGDGEKVVLKDTKRCSRYNIGGKNNEVVIKGDKKANTFNIGGENNKVLINRIGNDDNVQLQGKPEDWSVLEEGSSSKDFDCDGYVIMYNKKTGTTVVLGTDKGRDCEFVKSRITYI